ncbi:uncharacterized protein LOC124636840 [Helicoverpa zea]|uniref:uncharacterized protein LOC124636840 n=1 Tax=Helicoverpa zea TaxID=7113 RepID=UPI001F58204B|nr:uncharacterized protein LOC124636840 [Helicoverpa zea]
MLISKVSDHDEGQEESAEVSDGEGNSHEYQTANELFELMAKNQNFDNSDVDKLTTRDLVLLYKNIDLGTKLMSNANELKRRKPNQHVETIVYNDEPESECSDLSDIYSNEDLHNVFLINKERLDLLNAPSSVENTLCHKLGGLDIQTSDLTTQYDKHFVFKDPYIKEQLKSFKLMNNASESEGAVLPASLLDYICCKRLEDNYNFYMDNIIRYVKHTIEQLKRISNGDFLTDRAKEKWREVENTAEDLATTKVLATSTSIPLHVERKIGGRKSTWDDIVHSAVDIRSLSKILEKKIVVEVPKLLCGSYKLLSKCCADNVIISCKKDKRPVEETMTADSRVDVVFQLQRSETGQVISKISSIMILQTAPLCAETLGPEIMPLPLAYTEQTNGNRSPDRTPRIVELEPICIEETIPEVSAQSECELSPIEFPIENFDPYRDNSGMKGYECSDNEGAASLKNSGSCQESSDSSDALRDILDRKLKYAKQEASSNMFPDDLRMTIQKLTMQGPLAEESGEDMSPSTAMKKKSLTRVRIKSPYENQSYIMEEKKRRKLLEVRERRERKKMALTENCKINKHHKYGKGAIMPQSASSVTKLSISNKSFYNSIYGQTTNVDPSKQAKGRNLKGKREVLEIDLECPDCDQETVVSTPDKPTAKNSKKYINRSYYLDDADTEMMYINMKQNDNEAKELCSASTSVISNDFRNNLNLLSQLIGPSETDLHIANNETSPDSKPQELTAERDGDIENGSLPSVLLASKNKANIVPSNSPNVEEHLSTEQKKLVSSVECRKSIDQIYDLMKKLGNTVEKEIESKSQKKYIPTVEKVEEVERRMSSTCQGSDSGTSLKHHLTSSNPSSFSFDKNNIEKTTSNIRKPESPSSVVPKVIISSKSSVSPKTDLEKNPKKDRRKPNNQHSPTRRVLQDNPLKAISQLLHEFEHVQKTRHKPVTEQKPAKKAEMQSSDGRGGSRQNSIKRRSRLEQHNDAQNERHARVTTPKDKKAKPYNVMDITKIPYQQIAVDDKHADRIPKKKITDILDEAKEARGEAVRGPSKNSRLNSLAQPKRTYVQAHSEEYQIKYGKTLMADRLQRLAAAPPPSLMDRNTGSTSSRSKAKRNGSDGVSAVSMKTPPVPPLERAFRARHSSSSSPEARDRINQGVGPSYKQNNAPETPQTLMKKMVAVDAYVKNHYGRATSSSVVSNETQSAQKSRVPLLPSDIELASSTSSPPIEESTELGSRLHYIINSIIKTTSQGLEVLTECHESNSKISKENTDDYSLAENVSRSEHASSDSDYNLDVLGDNKIITSVEKLENASKKIQKQNNVGETDATHHDLRPPQSVTELEKLENALCRHISVGNFQKRLRIKNLTLTPKQSMQQLFVLQSGDASSLVVKASVPQIKQTTANSVTDLTALPVLSKSKNLDWNFSGFPMQISTVGYAFPDYNQVKSSHRSSSSFIKLFDEVSKNSQEKKGLLDNDTAKQDNPSVIVAQPQINFEKAAQDDVQVTKLKAAETTDTHVEDSKVYEEKKQNDENNIEPAHTIIIDCSEPKKAKYTTISDNQEGNHLIVDNKEKGSTLANSESIEYTTSLDILVGLLNEIQKITTCQTQITNDDKSQNEFQQNKELQTILNNASIMDNSLKSSPCDLISFTSLDRLRQLESNPSLYSFYLSDNEGYDRTPSTFNLSSEIIPLNNKELLTSKPILADKEVSVDFIDRELVNKFTDVPSQLFPGVKSHSTNVTKSLIGVLNEPSAQSVFSFAEYHSLYSNASTLAPNHIGEAPQIIITRESNQSIAFIEIGNQTNNATIEFPNETKICNTKIETLAKNGIKKKFKTTKERYRLKTEFDPIMKMKRDILVTVYSILVFTVFAALSFPEILYRV